ncbi:MAG: PstS family phosphate ABC transporter substrate-binding protein [Desulfocucumaceae bacterium]
MRKYIVLTVLLLFVFTGCGQEDKKSFTRDNYPRVDGSTVTIPLSEALASRLLGMSGEEAKQYVRHNKTHSAYVNLIEGSADIIFVTEPSPDELALAKEKNIELEVVPVVKDAFVFLVNVKNPVDTLTVEQIQGMYQGGIVNWKEVGGPDREIVAYQRPKNSGSQTIMESMVMKNLKMAEPRKDYVPAGMGDLIEKVAGYDNSDRALGYSVYYYARDMYNRDTIKMIGINGVKPEKKSIMRGDYPFSIAYYAVIRKSDPENSPAKNLIKWILSKEGQGLVESTGYVPVK